MSYMLHITRSENWVDGKENPITKEEIRANIDKKFKIIDKIETTNPVTKEKIVIGEDSLQWKRNGKKIYMNIDEGNIDFPYIDDEMIEELKPLAERLNATIQGDDGEEY